MATTSDKSTRNIPEYRQIKSHTRLYVLPTGNCSQKVCTVDLCSHSSCLASKKERKKEKGTKKLISASYSLLSRTLFSILIVGTFRLTRLIVRPVLVELSREKIY